MRQLAVIKHRTHTRRQGRKLRHEINQAVGTFASLREEVEVGFQDLESIGAARLQLGRRDGASVAGLHQGNVPDGRLLEQVLTHPRLGVDKPHSRSFAGVRKSCQHLQRRSRTTEGCTVGDCKADSSYSRRMHTTYKTYNHDAKRHDPRGGDTARQYEPENFCVSRKRQEHTSIYNIGTKNIP